ncbi:DNA topoisomerase I, partial [Mesorhizobium sp. M00.F.Ca.ET.186.01.1.1]
QKRGYVALEEKRFIPTELGEIVITLIEEFFPEILNAEFTAHMESDLDEIEEGTANWVNILDAFYRGFAKRVAVAEEEMKEVELKDEESDETCELCGRVMVYKLGRFGKFLACSGFPDCRNTKPIVKETGVKCPQCETGHIIERKSKKSRIFYGCNQYPECDFVSWDKPIARPCPKCSSLMVEKKRKKQGVSVVCTKCDYQEE